MQSNGVNTELGEKGINLNGGQKKKISIARALYADKEIYLFDDPFSSLDYDFKHHFMDKCINQLLLNKTILMNTQCHEFVPKANKTILLK